MTTLVDRYFAVLEKIGVDDFDHPDLEALRRQMSEATMREADALEEFGQRKFGINDNS